MFTNFNKIVAEAKNSICTTNAALEAEIAKLNERASAAQGEVSSLTAEYDELLLAGQAEEAAEVRQRLEVQRDLCAALERQVRPLLAQREDHRRAAVASAAEKIAQAVNGPGNDAIRKAMSAAEALREQYLAALKELQTVQHTVSTEGRQLHRMCGQAELTVPGTSVARYDRDALLVSERDLAESQSTASIMW